MKLDGGSAIYGRVPFLLFADLLEGQTISCAEKLWNLLESYTDSITVPESFRSGNELEDFVVVANAIWSYFVYFRSKTYY